MGRAGRPNRQDRGELRSFDAFYADQYSHIVRLGLILTGRLAVAEELAQDVFVEAFRRWTALQDYERPEAWARRAVLNRAISTRRRYLVELRLLVRLGNERADVNPPFTDTSAELWREVRRLPRRQAQVLALLYGEDRTVEEVATILNCSPDTVRTHLRRGRLALADRLSVEGENETSGTQ